VGEWERAVMTVGAWIYFEQTTTKEEKIIERKMELRFQRFVFIWNIKEVAW
jgi:hypothetical protein